MVKPSERIASALEGKIPLEQLSEAELSAIRFPIYQQACQVLRATKEKQVAYFNQLAPDVRDMLKKECRRIYDLRRGKK